eukprot:TRINITY_DN810_c0_g1_i3.p1 TRINITY_DN810_c0_g1~~TRINITY_DN810_c0_g1_i3.p1  ORF type:complete len:679 (-),score=215.94 TRINITY_DN810_c0_g1_i3:42-2078(-)
MKLKLVFLILIFGCIFAETFVYKHPQGSPKEFNSYLPPTPEETATHSGAAILDIDLKQENGKLLWKSEIPVDADEQLTISIISPLYQHLSIQILQPNSKLMNIHSMSQVIEEDFGIDGARFPAHSFQFQNPVKGIWQILVTCTNARELIALKSKQKSSNIAEGKVIASNYSPYKIAAHLASLETIKDGKVGFEMRLVDDSTPKSSLLHDPIVLSTLKAELDVTEPNGEDITVQMNDEGLFGDRIANDGIYFGQIDAEQTGRYISQIIVTGTDPKGNPLLRTTEITFDVVADNIEVNGAYANYDENNQVFDIYLRVDTNTLLKDSNTKRFKIWSQVWGENSSKQMVPVSWVSGYAELQQISNGAVVLGRIELNHRWIALAGVVSNLQFRNLRVRDPEWSVMIEDISSLNIDAQIPELKLSQKDQPLDVITLSMQYGWKTEEYSKRVSNPQAVNFKVTLVHGYCAQSNPFPIADFTNAVHFNGGLGQSLSNDEFSRRVISFLSAQQINSTSLIGHSQGGMVSTHTYNYYITPLDEALKTKQRVIQSVGTPYQGSSLAGSVAGLGEIFGVGCGSNNDLSLAGAQSWLSDIANGSRNVVYYYFTQYESKLLKINSCSIAANLILKWPNDGTTENEFAVLTGGNNQPSNPKQGWCHTTNMNHPPQCEDAERNKLMSLYANGNK